jgi:predicted AlkP superfamily pyrophosphatase or phosphodiesterase
MTVAAAKSALVGEKLGQTKSNDILAISFSSFDIAGHHFGPNSNEMREMTVAQDKAIAEIRAAVAAQVPGGLKNVLFVVTGDHGVAPKPEYLSETGIDSGRINEPALMKEINEDLNKKFGNPPKRTWMAYTTEFNFFIDEENVREAKLDLRRVENEINKTYFIGRSGHVVGIQKPFYVNDTKGSANHMTGYTYDRTVPIILSGFGIKNGIYSGSAAVVDIAPTISFLLGVLPPALSEGHVLSQALK